MFHLRTEAPADAPAIEQLLDRAFGPDRFAKASYTFRRGVPPATEFARVAESDGRLVGAIRYWPVAIDGAAALLLGPLGVEPALRGRGIGRALVRASLAAVDAGGEPLPILLVGDPGYYAPFGFVAAPREVVMPGEDPARLLLRADGPPPRPGTLRPWTATRATGAEAGTAALN